MPSWAVLPTGDKAAGSDVLRLMAKRAGARTVEIDGSHVIMISQPDAVAAVILGAVADLRARPGDLSRGLMSAPELEIPRHAAA
jgi:hypothetical protein